MIERDELRYSVGPLYLHIEDVSAWLHPQMFKILSKICVFRSSKRQDLSFHRTWEQLLQNNFPILCVKAYQVIFFHSLQNWKLTWSIRMLQIDFGNCTSLSWSWRHACSATYNYSRCCPLLCSDVDRCPFFPFTRIALFPTVHCCCHNSKMTWKQP